MKNAKEVLFNETSLKRISQIRVSFLRFWDKLSFFGTSRAPSPTIAIIKCCTFRNDEDDVPYDYYNKVLYVSGRRGCTV